MGVGQLSESDAVDALRLPFYSSSHPTGSHGWRNQFDLGNPDLDRLLGLLSQTMGNRDQAMAHFEDALVSCHKAGYRPELAWSCCDYADALRELDYDDVYQNNFELPEGAMVIDVTGLAKPAIFRLVSQALARDRTVLVAHTQANLYYPLDQDIAPIISPNDSDDMFAVLEKAREIWMGEKGPYQFVRLLSSDVDQARRDYCASGVTSTRLIVIGRNGITMDSVLSNQRGILPEPDLRGWLLMWPRMGDMCTGERVSIQTT